MQSKNRRGLGVRTLIVATLTASLLSGSQSSSTERPGSTLAGPTWLADATRTIAELEYAWSVAEPGTLTAPNRAHGLRARLDARGLEVTPREAVDEPFVLRLDTLALSRLGQANAPALEQGRVSAQGSLGIIERGGLQEWFRNEPRGIEQGWIVRARVAGEPAAPLVIELASAGLDARVTDDARSAVFVDEAGTTRLRYTGLRAWDAGGRALGATLEAAPGCLRVLVDDADALYPITVDPVLSGPIWSYTSSQAGAELGVSVSRAGDINGDGFGDLLVGAYLFDAGQVNEGRAFLFYGSAGGAASTPDWSAEPNQAGAQFGRRVSTAGDVNGDGFPDVLIGSHRFDGAVTDGGRVYVYYGSATGPSATPDWTVDGLQGNADFGFSLGDAGDVNGDGFDDVLVGAWRHDSTANDEGAAFLYLGAPTGPSTTADWISFGAQGLAGHGFSLGGGGDVNNDGFDDVLVGAWRFDAGQVDEGRVALYLGTASVPASTPDWTVFADQDQARLGASVAGAGDVDGDGFDDIVAGAYQFDDGEAGEGAAFLYRGSISLPSSTPDWSTFGDQVAAQFGFVVSGAGDVNGDGFDDLLVGAPGYDDGETNEGRAFLYMGAAAGPGTIASWTDEGEQAQAEFGFSVASAGDVNGDTRSDVLVGARLFDGGLSDEGAAFLYFGQRALDCNGNGVDDDVDLAGGRSLDCNTNGIPDECDIASGTSSDLDMDGIPDECQADCNGNGVPDVFDISQGTSQDCNRNLVPDECDVAGGTSLDCNLDGIPDECQLDCNANGVPDDCDIGAGTSLDCDANGVPDECEPDCNANGTTDACDIAGGTSQDCNTNGVPDECDISSGSSIDDDADGIPDECQDCNTNGIADSIDLANGTSDDCNTNGVPDECDIASGASRDCDLSGVPDSCEIAAGAPDCNANNLLDSCELDAGIAEDCNVNGLLDECDITAGTSSDCDADGVPDECQPDCNENGVADTCDLASGTSQDADMDGIPDECQDCNQNGVPDSLDIAQGTSLDCNANDLPDECDLADGTSADCNNNAIPDECDISAGTSDDCDQSGVPDECQPDCNANGQADPCDLASGSSQDCNENSVPDECDIANTTSADCNDNDVPDECDISSGSSLDDNANGNPDECDCAPVPFCVTAPNSFSAGARMGSNGMTSIAADAFEVRATGVPPGRPGIFFFGNTSLAGVPFGDGFRCVGGQLRRLQPPIFSSPGGEAVRLVPTSSGPLQGIQPFQTRSFQFWFRDPMGPGGNGFNLTDGLAVTFCP